MPLIKKSSKAVDTMSGSKPSLAIALAVRTKNKKKMAQGGTIEASTEKRPTADNQDAPSRDKHIGSQEEDFVSESRPSTKNAHDSREMSMTMNRKLMRSQEEDFVTEDKASIDGSHDDREMTMIKGKSLRSPEEINAKSEGRPSADSRDQRALTMLAKGGMAMNPKLEQAMKGAKSIAEAIRIKKMYANGGEVDLSENAEESPNVEDQLSWNALRKENYSESPALGDLEYDTSESIGDDLSDEDEHGKDMISKIMAKRRSK